MAAGLTGDLVAQLLERPSKFRHGNISWQFHSTEGADSTLSSTNDLFAHEMQAEDFGRLSFVKEAFHRVANLGAQRVHGFGFGENGMTQSSGGESAFRRFFDEKN